MATAGILCSPCGHMMAPEEKFCSNCGLAKSKIPKKKQTMSSNFPRQFMMFKVPMSPYKEDWGEEWPCSMPADRDRILDFRKDETGHQFCICNSVQDRNHDIKVKGYIGDVVMLLDPYELSKDYNRYYRVVVFKPGLYGIFKTPPIPFIAYLKGEDLCNGDKLQMIQDYPPIVHDLFKREKMIHGWDIELREIKKQAKAEMGDSFKGFTTPYVDTCLEIFNTRFNNRYAGDTAKMWNAYSSGFLTNSREDESGRHALDKILKKMEM